MDSCHGMEFFLSKLNYLSMMVAFWLVNVDAVAVALPSWAEFKTHF